MAIVSIIDVILCLSSVSLAAAVFLAKDTFTAIVLFICLGLVITLCWLRLSAIDVAIAEAAIGTGLTGAMLLAAWRKLEYNSNKESNGDQ